MPIPEAFVRKALCVVGFMSFLSLSWVLLLVAYDGDEGLWKVTLVAGFFNDMLLLFLYTFAKLKGALDGSPRLASAASALVQVLLSCRFGLLMSPARLDVAAFFSTALIGVLNLVFLSEERHGFASPYRWIGRQIHSGRRRRRMQAPIQPPAPEISSTSAATAATAPTTRILHSHRSEK